LPSPTVVTMPTWIDLALAAWWSVYTFRVAAIVVCALAFSLPHALTSLSFDGAVRNEDQAR